VSCIQYGRVHLAGWVDDVRLDEERVDELEFRDFVGVAKSLTGSFDLDADAYDQFTKALGVHKTPLVDLEVTSRKPQLVLQRRRSVWRSRLRFQVIAETYTGVRVTTQFAKG
jgi:hypothetical protein